MSQRREVVTEDRPGSGTLVHPLGWGEKWPGAQRHGLLGIAPWRGW